MHYTYLQVRHTEILLVFWEHFFKIIQTYCLCYFLFLQILQVVSISFVFEKKVPENVVKYALFLKRTSKISSKLNVLTFGRLSPSICSYFVLDILSKKYSLPMKSDLCICSISYCCMLWLEYMSAKDLNALVGLKTNLLISNIKENTV